MDLAKDKGAVLASLVQREVSAFADGGIVFIAFNVP